MRLAIENFGESKLAERFGIKRYPAVFVDDVLVAKPNDFGFFGAGENPGRYTPWLDSKSHEKFKQDLARMIDLALAGKEDALRAERATSDAPEEIAAIPQFSLTDLAGKPLTSGEVAGRVVVVEFWATWCPPCHDTLAWLGKLPDAYGNKVAVLALAVESPEDAVRKTVSTLDPNIRSAVATPEVSRAFGDVIAVPALFVFDSSGKTMGTLLGAPPDLHESIRKLIEAALH